MIEYINAYINISIFSLQLVVVDILKIRHLMNI